MVERFKYGFDATLFPMTSSDEDKATSILFSILNLIQPFRDDLLKTIGKTAYKSGNDFTASLHPSFGGKYSKKDIPDGIISLDQKEIWSALVEVKIKGQDLTAVQLDNYLKRVHQNKLSALITISNELCTQPDMPPLRLKSSNKNYRKIPHYHWSWRFILHRARILLGSETAISELERSVLAQFVSFLEHEKSGVTGFHSMPKDWKNFVSKLRDRGTPDQALCEEVVSSWFQESSELALILSSDLETEVEEVFSDDTSERRREHATDIVKTRGDLKAEFKIDGHKYLLSVCLDIDRRTLQFSTRHDLPKTAKTPYKQVEHFLRHFHQDNEEDEWGGHDDVRIFAHWPRVKLPTDMTMFDAIQHSLDDELKNSKFINPDKDRIMNLELRYTPSKVSSKIESRKGVISLIEDEIIFFARNYVILK